MLIFIGLHRWIYNVVRGICSFTFLLKYIIWKTGHNVVNSANFEMKIHVLWDATLLHGVKLEQLFSLVCLALKMKLKKKTLPDGDNYSPNDKESHSRKTCIFSNMTVRTSNLAK